MIRERPAYEYHVGRIRHVEEVLARLRRGLPVYMPTDPKPIDQRPYLAFAAERGPNSQ